MQQTEETQQRPQTAKSTKKDQRQRDCEKNNQELNGVMFGTGPKQIKLKAALINSSQRLIESRKIMI